MLVGEGGGVGARVVGEKGQDVLGFFQHILEVSSSNCLYFCGDQSLGFCFESIITHTIIHILVAMIGRLLSQDKVARLRGVQYTHALVHSSS